MKLTVRGLCLFLSLCICGVVNGADSYTYRSNQFYVAFPKNGNFLTLQIPKLHITSVQPEPVNVSITSSIGIQYSLTVQPHSTESIIINKDLLVADNTETNKGIHVRTMGGELVSLYATNYVTSSAGGFAVLPLFSYEDAYIPEYIYYAFSTDTDPSNAADGLKGVVLITAGNDNTTVIITPSQSVTIPSSLSNNGTTTNVPAGTSYTLTMDRLQTLLLNNVLDLSGTRIASNKPLSVVSGHECGIVPPRESFCDYMVEQIPPSVTWGHTHLAMPFAERDSGALFKIISDIPNNQLNITCTSVSAPNNHTHTSVTLATGVVTTHQITNEEWCSFTSQYPVIISQYAFGGLHEIGDPLSMVLVPIEQYTDITQQDYITPESPFINSIIPNKEHIVGVLALGPDPPENITLDGTTEFNDLEWRPIYDSNEVILGHGVTVGITEAPRVLSSLSSSPILASVLLYGFTLELNAFGYPLNGALELESLPWYISFDQSNYTILENKQYQIPVTSVNHVGVAVTLGVRNCPGTEPLSNVVFDNTITFNPNDKVQFISINAIDDSNIEGVESMCLELTTPTSQLAYLHPMAQTNIFIEDDEDIQLSLSNLQLTPDHASLALTLSLSGYEGDTDGAAIVTVSIAHDGMLLSSTPISTFTLLFTRFLTQVQYSVPFSYQGPAISSNSLALLTVSNTDLNISVIGSALPLLPLTPPTPSPSSSQSPTTTVTMTTVATVSVPIISQSPSSSPVDITQEPVTTVLNTRADTVELDLYILYLIIGLISVLGITVLMLIIAVVCFYKVSQRRSVAFDKNGNQKDLQHHPSKAQLLSSQPSLHNTSTSSIAPAHRLSGDSAISFGRSASPSSRSADSTSRSNSPDENGLVPPKPTYLLKTNNMDESSPRHSMAGSKDNLLQQTSPV